jgi:outer membrane protein assembly factor BamB
MRSVQAAAVGILGCVLLAGGVLAAPQDWPQWRGPNRDNKVAGFVAPSTWPKDLTKKWSVTVGVGDASPVLVGDNVYVFTRQSGDEVTTCLNAGDGNEVWHDKYAAEEVKGAPGRHPGPRATPAVAEGKVCTFGVGGVLSCLDAEKGTVVWRKETKSHPYYYTASSPIIVDGKCVAYVGDDKKGDFVGYDLTSGDEKWKCPGDGAGYASPVVITVDGVKQIVTLANQSVVAVGAADGKPLWQIALPAKGMGAVNSITPIVDGQTIIYAQEGSGTTAVKVEKKDDGFAAAQLWQKKQAPGRFNTPVLRDGLLYGLVPAGKGFTNLFCMKADSGDVLWTDSAKRGECGAILDAGDVLLALTSDSQLVAFKPGDKGYTELAGYKVADSPTWAMPVVAGKRVFVKDKEALTLWTLE